MEIKPMTRIGGVFAKNRLNLLHGLQGHGKSFGCVKALNADGIKPIHINLDDSNGLESLDTYNVRDVFMYDFLGLKMNKDSFIDEVIILDTYTRFEAEVFARNVIRDKIGLFTLLEDAMNYYEDCTIIVIGHTANYANSKDIFNDNTDLVRGCAEELRVEKVFYKATKTNPARTSYNLFICKGRGYEGDRHIIDWNKGE